MNSIYIYIYLFNSKRCNDLTEISLKVALNTINLNQTEKMFNNIFNSLNIYLHLYVWTLKWEYLHGKIVCEEIDI